MCPAKKMIVVAFAFISLAIIGCATAFSETKSTPIANYEKYQKTKRFTNIDIMTPSGSKSYIGEYFIESGYQTWSITNNNVTEIFHSYMYDVQPYRGIECARYPLSSKGKDGKLSEVQMYLCGDMAYLVYLGATIKYYNK